MKTFRVIINMLYEFRLMHWNETHEMMLTMEDRPKLTNILALNPNTS